MTNKLFKTMVRNVIQDARDVENKDYADAYLDICNVSHKCIELCDWYNHDIDRNYTITNPDYINLDWLKERLVVTKSVSELDYQIDTDALMGYINQFFPKELLTTLNRIVICNDGEKDFEELYNNPDFGDMVEICDLPDADGDRYLGIYWFEFNVVAVNLGGIINCAKASLAEDIADGFAFESDVADDVNREVIVTLVHELRHLAQGNPYLPKEVLQQESDKEEDAEEFARNLVDEHNRYVLKHCA